MKDRGGCIWLGIGLVLAAIAGAVAFTTMMRATAAAPVLQQEVAGRTVVVAAVEIPMRTVISEGDVAVREMPADLVPSGAAVTLEEVVGKISKIDLVPGEILYLARLADPNVANEDIAFTVEEGQVVMAFPASDLMSQIKLLKPGDRVDILFSLNFTPPEEEGTGESVGRSAERLATFNALQNLEISGIVMPTLTDRPTRDDPNRPLAILLALDPQDALILKHLKDAGGIVDIVLRAPTDSQHYNTDPVDVEFLVDRYRIPVPGRP